ncbi:STAS-like domain-containing protein [Conexibacter stalactiti]|uniref:STAS-like domain-containing protein n=1 Tax=Conexibacter stalactiti TaxID=1940611 RepID=A0ABU4HRN6_9ACTN|nr:STAS-like domain-containing protein [Conexibacter stalactiti]MDW5595933.1 STAS-like domain-containing protein [Conexibacter stalactiti]MEC5036575.1 STAS-like domain-containing protein [Conexibacter stalactiti]
MAASPTDTTTTIRPAQQLGSVLVGRDDAAALRKDVRRRAARGESVVLDFAGVDVLAPSFADELLGKLPRELLTTGSVRVEHLDPASAALAQVQTYARDESAVSR